MRQLQVIALCLKNALFLTTYQMINKRKYNCALDTHLYGQMYYNVTGPSFTEGRKSKRRRKRRRNFREFCVLLNVVSYVLA